MYKTFTHYSILVAIIVLFTMPGSVLAVSENELESCTLKTTYCKNLLNNNCKAEFLQVVDDFKYLLSTVNLEKLDKEQKNNTLYQFVQAFNFLESKKQQLIKEYDNGIKFTIDYLNQLELSKKENSLLYQQNLQIYEKSKKEFLALKNDQQKIKEECVLEAEKAKQAIAGLVPIDMKKEFEIAVVAMGGIEMGVNTFSFEDATEKMVKNLIKESDVMIPKNENANEKQGVLESETMPTPDKKQGFVHRVIQNFFRWIKKIF